MRRLSLLLAVASIGALLFGNLEAAFALMMLAWMAAHGAEREE